MYVYILSDYEEYGAENIHATLDRSKLLTMLKTYWPHYASEHDAMMELLTKPDSDLATDKLGFNLSKGWGGIQFHVVILEA